MSNQTRFDRAQGAYDREQEPDYWEAQGQAFEDEDDLDLELEPGDDDDDKTWDTDNMEDELNYSNNSQNLNAGQLAALARITEFLAAPAGRFFLLSGDAGTGKTYCIKQLIEEASGKIVFTAPTNKATKVLRTTLTTDTYSPICRTIYSLLGLKLEPSGILKKLVAPEDPINLKDTRIVVIDEASMINKLLWKEIKNAAEAFKLKIILLGDSNQLPPVGEPFSEVWGKVDLGAELTEVVRFDNQILTFAQELKGKVNHPAPSIALKSDNDEVQGVFLMESREFRAEIMKRARLGDFSRTEGQTKAIAWRNVTVDTLNALIRSQIFEDTGGEAWLPGDRVLLTAPASDLSGNGRSSLGCTDDEGSIERITIAYNPLYSQFKCYNISLITDENKRISLWVLHPDSTFDFKMEEASLANAAKAAPRKWKDFWAFKEAFHSIKHAYAITAHRAQGSTYDNAFVVWNDILLNRNRGEAFRCLYVASTRAKHRLYLGSI